MNWLYFNPSERNFGKSYSEKNFNTYNAYNSNTFNNITENFQDFKPGISVGASISVGDCILKIRRIEEFFEFVIVTSESRDGDGEIVEKSEILAYGLTKEERLYHILKYIESKFEIARRDFNYKLLFERCEPVVWTAVNGIYCFIDTSAIHKMLYVEGSYSELFKEVFPNGIELISKVEYVSIPARLYKVSGGHVAENNFEEFQLSYTNVEDVKKHVYKVMISSLEEINKNISESKQKDQQDNAVIKLDFVSIPAVNLLWVRRILKQWNQDLQKNKKCFIDTRF